MKNKLNSDTYAVIGLGRFGNALAARLIENGKDVIIVDRSEAAVRPLREQTEYAFVTDSLTRESLEEMGIAECGTVIICMASEIDQNILTALNVINLGVERVIAKAVSSDHGMILEKIGAEVVYPERDMAQRLADNISFVNALESIMLNNEVSITELTVSSHMANKKIIELPLRKKYGANIIAIEHDGSTTVEIDPQYTLQSGDVITVISKKDKAPAIARIFG